MSEAVELREIKDQVSAEEWAVREDLAAAYRLVAHYGWDDMVFTHLSARVPGPEDHFLLNPLGFLFSEVTASNLVKIDCDGNVVLTTDIVSTLPGSPSTVPFICLGPMPRRSCTCIPMQVSRGEYGVWFSATDPTCDVCLPRYCVSRMGRCCD